MGERVILNNVHKQCIACALPTMLPRPTPPWTSVAFTGRSAELRNRVVLARMLEGLKGVGGRSGPIVIGTCCNMALGNCVVGFTTDSSHRNGLFSVSGAVDFRHIAVLDKGLHPASNLAELISSKKPEQNFNFCNSLSETGHGSFRPN